MIKNLKFLACRPRPAKGEAPLKRGRGQAGKIKNSRAGFTLLEVIVVVSITALLSVAMLANFRSGEKERLLAITASQVAQNARLAQNLASSLKELNGTTPCGWGIHYTGASGYVLFADRAGCASGNPHRYDGGEETQTFIFNDNRVIFASAFPDIFFLPPDPVTYINGASGSGLEGRIRVCLVSDCAAKYKEVVIKGTGVVEIQ